MKSDKPFTPKELEEIFGPKFLFEFTSMIANIGDNFEDRTPEDWAYLAICRLDEMGYQIVSKSGLSNLIHRAALGR